MALKRKGKYWYGTTPEDLQEEVRRHSRQAGYETVRYAASACPCGGRAFRLESDEDAGVARRSCVACGEAKLMGDSAEHADEANLESHECICDAETFELLSGVALYAGSEDIRWYYLGCHCTGCDLVGVFADWKCEAGDAEVFLAEV